MKPSTSDATPIIAPLAVAVAAIGVCGLHWQDLCSQPLLASATFFIGFCFAVAQPSASSARGNYGGKALASHSQAPPSTIPPPQVVTAWAPAAPANAPAPPSCSDPRLLQLRQLLAPAAVNDEEASRFLAYKRGNVAMAAKLLAACAEWRRKEGIDGILDEPSLQPPERQAALDHYFRAWLLDGSDHKGRPVFYMDMGKINVPALRRSGVDVTVVVRRYTAALESVKRALAKNHAARAESSQAAAAAHGYTFIINIRDATAGSFLSAWKLWVAIASIEANYYPCLVRACCPCCPRVCLVHRQRRQGSRGLLALAHSPCRDCCCDCRALCVQVSTVAAVRSPSIGPWAFGMCKRSFLDKSISEKVVLDAAEDPTPTLAKLMPAELIAQLPREVGGTRD